MDFIRWFCVHFIKILKAPHNFWSNFEPPKRNVYVICFGFICVLIGFGLEALGQIFLIDMTQHALKQDSRLVAQLSQIFAMPPEKWMQSFLTQLLFLKKQSALMLVLLPIAPYFVIYLFAGALHFTMNLFGHLRSPEASYEKTFRIVCFSFAPVVFAAIPFVGTWIAVIWVLVLLVKGLGQNYQLSFFQSLFSVLMPAFLIKMIWIVAVQSLILAMPNTYFEKPLMNWKPRPDLLSPFTQIK